MSLSQSNLLAKLLAAARFTVQNPRSGARMVMNFDLPIAARWAALALMAVASSLLTIASMALSPFAEDPAVQLVTGNPIVLAIFEMAVLALAVVLMHRVGRQAGGQGSFDEALILMVWLQTMLMILQLLQLAAQLILPPLADIIGLLGMGLFLWLLVNFVAELHGFRSLLLVFGGIIATGFAISLLAAVLLIAVVGV